MAEMESQKEGLQEEMLRRLKLQLEKKLQADTNEEGHKLLDRAIYSTFVDCRALGCGEEAQKLLDVAGFGKKDEGEEIEPENPPA